MALPNDFLCQRRASMDSPPKKASAERRRQRQAAPHFRFTTTHYNSALWPSDPSDGRIRPSKGPSKGTLFTACQILSDLINDSTRASFCKIFEVFVASETCWDLFGPARMHLDTFGCVRKLSEAFGRFWNFKFLDFFNIFRACVKYRRSQ